MGNNTNNRRRADLQHYEFRFDLGKKVISRINDSVEGIVIQNIAEINENGILDGKRVQVKLVSGQTIVLPEEDLILIREDSE